MSISFDGIWNRGLDVLATAIDATTRTITAMLGDAVGEETISSNAEWWQPQGFASRPSKPTKGRPSAQVVLLRGSDVDACIACRDLRCQDIYGSLDYGETCIFAPGEDGTGQARILLKKDGGIHLYTRQGNTSGGAGMTIQVDAANNTIRLLNGNGHGIIIDATGVRITAKDAGITVSSGTGNIVVAGKGDVSMDGGNVLLGMGSSPPVPAVTNVIHGATGVSGVASSKVHVGV
jgi:hypothetical protein